MKFYSYHLLFLLLILFSTSLFSQNSNSYILKTEALQLINSERYGEAIDVLNKLVSADPNSAESFNLRGLCYEKRGNYEFAVYDYRTAKKINPADEEISSNLNRATSDWYKLLYNKIEGHKREIAINPSIAKNYLEIGKCYKNLGNWSEAEIWYDLYLEKENASADEIIRYSEILAKNGHLTKGETVLKSYLEKDSNDHRIFSRYGYFNLWLGKYKIAEDAFKKSLEIRPYFKEAMDGLDLAKGKGYVYSINDTTSSFTYGMPPPVKEYEIDKLFRMIKNNPADNESRFILTDKLIFAKRFEEANQQLQVLASLYSDTERYKNLLDRLNSSKNIYYTEQVKLLENKLLKSPADKKTLLELAKFYSLNNDYLSAENIYKKYLTIYPNDSEVKFGLAQILMWQNNLCDAFTIANELVNSSSDNIDYLLLAAKINFWLDKDLNYSESLYEKVLRKDSKNIDALFGLADVYLKSKNIPQVENLIDKISSIESKSEQYIILNLDLEKLKIQNQLEENYKILEDARIHSAKKNYNSAIKFYKEYLSTDPNNNNVQLELADVYSANKELTKSISIYDELLQSNNNYTLEKQRAKFYLWNGDSSAALQEFKKLNQKNPEDVETKLLLGDSFLQNGQIQNARNIYEELLLKSPDSYIIKTRLNWLGGSDKFSFDRFPIFTQFIPIASYFTDNTDFGYLNYGLGFNLGVTNFLTIGLSGARGKLSSEINDLRFNQIKGSAYIKLNETFSANGSFGQTFFTDDLKENIIEFALTTRKENRFYLTGYLNYSDAAFNLYSPFLVNSRLNAYQYGANGEYRFKNGLMVSGKYFYLNISDENTGNQFIARLGKEFEQDFTAGYEYYFYSLKFMTPLYWSPKNFESHSLWADWLLYQDEVFKFNVGGKIGLILQNDYVVSEFNVSVSYQIINNLLLQSRFSTGSSFRSGVGYRSNSIQASLILGL